MNSLLAFTAAICLTSAAFAQIPAFPGAEGFGATTPGGRGGPVLFVTNLDDSGPGSLRAAIQTRGPRIILFRVGGIIDLRSSLTVSEPFVTIAGQSAPGDGICIRGDNFNIRTHDVAVRFMRFRLGDVRRREVDAVSISSGARNVILDHVSASWSVDETLSPSGSISDVTVQWSMISESLHRSVHSEGPHGYGTLLRATGGVSMHHNLWAHHNGRNPRFGDNYGEGAAPTFDFRNNVIYNYGSYCSGMNDGKIRVNYVANFIKPGPNSSRRQPLAMGTDGTVETQFHVAGNIVEGRDDWTADNTLMFDRREASGRPVFSLSEQPFDAPPVATIHPNDAFVQVVARAGAILPVRDAVDKRIATETLEASGRLIDSQTDVGGWPVCRSDEPPRDSDGDGIPDFWERLHFLDPDNPADGSAAGAGGYTNIENYVNELAQSRPPDVVVATDGSGDYASVQAAVNAVPANNRRPIVIHIKPGIYRERITVPADKHFITFRGDDPETTLLTFNGSAATDGSTSASGSLFLRGANFTAENLTFENSYGTGSQAVAVYVTSDRAVFRNCRFLGWQDTLYANAGRQYYKNCYIEGHVDFIFGNAAAVFEACQLHSKGQGYITAHSRTSESETTGYVFDHCSLSGENTGRGVYLGRPWRPFSRVVYLNCWMWEHIRPQGWDNWGNAENEKTAWYGEFNSSGPGANPDARVRWSRQLSEKEAAQFAPRVFLAGSDGWNPLVP